MKSELYRSSTQIQKKAIRQYFIGSIIIAVLPSLILHTFYSNSLQQEYVIKVQQLSESILAEKKRFLKNAIDRTIYLIESQRELVALEADQYSYSQDQIEIIAKQRITKAIRNLRLIDDGYIWVNQVVDFKGGENYAIRLIHPNLPETEGSFLSTHEQDIKGNKPYAVELEGVKVNGDVFFDYYFKKIDTNEIVHKISYAKLYPDYNWIIATGVYLDDVDKLISEESDRMRSTFEEQKTRSISIAILALLSSLLVIAIFAKRIRKLIQTYEGQVQQREHTLEENERSTKAILDSLSPQVVIIDHLGMIVDTNASWRRFAEDNGLSHGWRGTAFNYLNICDSVIKPKESDAASQSAIGIRSVLNGEVEEFSLVYECSSLKEQRWFNMRVRRIANTVPAKAVIAHEDITAMKSTEQALRALSQQDGLSGLANRRFFEETLSKEWFRAARDNVPLSLLILDIDYFKMLNDRYGHLEGDECIKSFAFMLRSELKRPADLAARYGGEEFVALLPNTTAEAALALAEEVCDRTRELKIPNIDSLVSKNVTVSIGVACINPSPDIEPKELIDLADKALYQAKRDGRNRVCKL